MRLVLETQVQITLRTVTGDINVRSGDFLGSSSSTGSFGMSKQTVYKI